MTSVTPIFFKNTENRPSMGVSAEKSPPFLEKVWIFFRQGNQGLSNSQFLKLEIWKKGGVISKVSLIFRNINGNNEEIRLKMAPTGVAAVSFEKTTHYVAIETDQMKKLIDIFEKNVNFTLAAKSEIGIIKNLLEHPPMQFSPFPKANL